MTFAIVAFALLQAGDVLTTRLVLDRGVGFEANPVAIALLAHGWGVAVLLKALLVLAFALYAYPLHRRGSRLGIVNAVNVVMAFIVLSNAGIALRA